MDILQVQRVIPEIEPGLRKYEAIMAKYPHTDVSKDGEFQRLFNGFYRMRQRKPEFYSIYYALLEARKGKPTCFEDVLRELYQRTGRVEASFSSKLLATLDPCMPVWNTFVLKNLNLSAPGQTDKNRLDKIIALYAEICNWYASFFQTAEAAEAIRLFDQKYPNTQLTDLKKIDLILWRIRK